MFYKDILTDQPKCFRIGDFVVSAKTESVLLNEPVSIPGSFMAFEENAAAEPDIRFVLDLQQELERGKEIFRAENYMNNVISECGAHAWEYRGLDNGESAGMIFRVEKDFSHITMTKADAAEKYIVRELGILFEYALLSRKDACMLHGILLEYRGRGILLLARSGVGKSTHAHLWRDYENALILDGDRCLCRKIDGRWMGYGSPWCGTSGEYINRKIPISDIVFLDRGPENRVESMNAFEGTIRLLESIKAPTWEPSLYLKAMDLCDALVRDIPLWHLQCTPDKQAMLVLKEALFGGEDR